MQPSRLLVPAARCVPPLMIAMLAGCGDATRAQTPPRDRATAPTVTPPATPVPIITADEMNDPLRPGQATPVQPATGAGNRD